MLPITPVRFSVSSKYWRACAPAPGAGRQGVDGMRIRALAGGWEQHAFLKRHDKFRHDA